MERHLVLHQCKLLHCWNCLRFLRYTTNLCAFFVCHYSLLSDSLQILQIVSKLIFSTGLTVDIIFFNWIVHLRENMQWLWCCTVHVYVVIDFCDCMWSFWVAATLWRFLSGFFIYVFPLEIQLSREDGWNPINRLNPATLLRLFQAMTLISNVICRLFSLSVFSELRWQMIVFFVDISGIVDHLCLNFLDVMFSNRCRSKYRREYDYYLCLFNVSNWNFFVSTGAGTISHCYEFGELAQPNSYQWDGVDFCFILYVS